MSRYVNLRRLSVVLTVFALVLSGCNSSASTTAPVQTGSTTAPAQSAGNTPAAQSPAPSSGDLKAQCLNSGTITLNMESAETTNQQEGALQTETKAFESSFPNVTVAIDYKDFSTFTTTIKLLMASDNAPDVTNSNQGYDINGALIKAGLIIPLDSYMSAFGWDKLYTPATLNPNRMSTDGNTMGVGSLWEISPGVSMTGLFYNVKLLKQIGISDPTSLDSQAAFEAALAKAKAAGLTGIMLGDSEGWPAQHNVALLKTWGVSAQASNDWVYGKAGSTYDDAAHQAAAAEFQDWFAKGYFNSDANAITNSDAVANFVNNKAVFYVGGTWVTGEFYQGMGANVGFMLYPADSSGKHAATGSVTLPIAVSSKTKHLACSLEYLNAITASDVAISAMLSTGRIPATGLVHDIKAGDPLTAQEILEYVKVANENGLMAWEDWATPTMLEFWNGAVQSLLAGKMTPAEYTKQTQANWAKFQSTR